MVQLSDEWKKELNFLKDNINYDRFKDLAAILHNSDIIIETLNSKRMNSQKMDYMDWICSYFFSHCYHLTCSIFQLSKLGYGSSGIILSRAILESLVNLSYLWLCKKINNTDDERQAFFEYEVVQRYKMDNGWKEMQEHRKTKGLSEVIPKELFTVENSKLLSQKNNEYKLKYPNRKDWAIVSNVHDRAREVDNLNILTEATGIILEEDYHMIYRWSSELVHGSSSSSVYYIQEESKGFSFNFGATFEDIDIVLPIVARSMVSILYIVNHINHLNIDLYSQLVVSGLRTNRKPEI